MHLFSIVCHTTTFPQCHVDKNYPSCTGFPRLLENPGIFVRKFPGPGKSWKMTLVLERPGNILARSWKVLEFARQ